MMDFSSPEAQNSREAWCQRNLSKFRRDAEGPWASSCCPLGSHNDKNPSFRVNLETGGYNCLACDGTGVLTKLAERLGLDPSGLPVASKSERPTGKPSKPKVVAEYIYQGADGSPVLKVLRFDPKGFSQQHLADGRWVKGVPASVPRPLYKWPELLRSTGPVIWVEGEKDADLLWSLGCSATTSPQGANSIGKIQASQLTFLSGRTVLVVPDNDEPGRKYAEAVCRLLAEARVSEVRLVELPGVPEKGDFSDWWQQPGRTKAELAGLLDSAESWEPKPGPTAPEAKLPLLEQAILAIGGDCDGAKEADGVGFSAKDTDFFAPHLNAARRGIQIALKFRTKALDRLSKYGKQLLSLGFNVNDLHAEESKLRAELKEQGESEKELTQSEILLEIASDWTLFQDSGQFFASFLVENAERSGTFRRETHRFTRGGVRAQLNYAFLKQEGYPPSTDALASVVSALEAKAQFEGPELPTFIRTAHHQDRFYVDLCDGLGTAVEISEVGWRLTEDPPVHFIRNRGMAALPNPIQGGSMEALKTLFGLPEPAWILLVSWLVYSLTPLGPFPVLLLEASAGSAKSTLVRMLKAIIDPSNHPPRGRPEDEEALVMQASNNWGVVLDNLVQVSDSISNALCIIATGGSFSRRMLYSNDEENVLSYRRPVILAGITGVVTKPDLGDRLIKISPPVIPDEKRRREVEVLAGFESLRGEVFGCLLDAISTGLRNEGKVKLPSLPRMADFSAFIIQAEEALPWAPGSFLRAFQEHRVDQVESALEGDPLANAVRQLVALNGTWRGSPTELRERLSKLVLREDVLPSSVRMSQRLRVLQPYLVQVGVEMDELRVRGSRVIELSKKSKPLFPEVHPFQPSPSSPSEEKPHNQAKKVGDTWGDTWNSSRHPEGSSVTPHTRARVTVESQGDSWVTLENIQVPPSKPLQNRLFDGQGDEGDTSNGQTSGNTDYLFSDDEEMEVGEI